MTASTDDEAVTALALAAARGNKRALEAWGNERIALSLRPDPLLRLLSDFHQLDGSVLDARSPIDGGHVPDEVGHAPVGPLPSWLGGAPASERA